jgi:hypothetical protein
MATDDELRRALPHAAAWGAASRTLAFRRIAALLIGAGGTADPQLRIEALAALETLRPQVPLAVRREAIELAAGRWPDRTMLWLFRGEALADLEPLIARLRLDESEWRALAPELPEATRRLVAGRVAGIASRHPAIEDGAREVVALIDRLQRDGAAAPVELAGDWRWECDSRGGFTFLDGPAPVAAGDRLFDLGGADAIWPSFARRVAFRGLRVDTAAGGCLLAGVPFFERGSGRFLGYRGTAQSVPAAGLFGTGASSESLAQVAHEVRSPLNAIMGFAQMIESETLGPAAEAYRQRAGAILDHAQRLLGALDDLTDAARLDRGHWPVNPAAVDAGALVERIAERHRALAAARGVSIAVTVAPGLPPALADERSLDRAVKRLLAAVIAVAEGGETLLLGVQRAGADIRLFLTRPSALDELTADRLLDTASVAGEGGGAPLLGLGFGLRLVRQLGEAMGGSFAIEPQRFTLTLPGADGDEQAVANEDQSA